MLGEKVSNNPSIIKNEKKLVEHLIPRFYPIFFKNSFNVGKIDVVEFEFNTGENKTRNCNGFNFRKEIRSRSREEEGQVLEICHDLIKIPKSDLYPLAQSLERLTDPQPGEAKYFIAIDRVGPYMVFLVKDKDQDKLTLVLFNWLKKDL
ncbi:unnamed protein product [Lepeophtheirus salmonis]|uniref:(salmon louse) hypothetical protein n=1 Tax=Lepeophtheirus salmonis TaxID=72036 RepID=A0A7R8H7E5_LEPSM|nr:unnamed protein product [Lepeophtheirus salmonis]CAF2919223.1 unnamed protein product [Lepeophtheirus salmonis]